MAEQNRRYTFSTPSLRDLCFVRLIEEVDFYSPEMLSHLPSPQRMKLLLLCPIITVCHLEHTCAFNGIDSEMFWDKLLRSQRNTTITCRHEIDTLKAPPPHLDSVLSSRERYFTYLTAIIFSGDRFSGHFTFLYEGEPRYYMSGGLQRSCPEDIVNHLVAYRKPNIHVQRHLDLEELEQPSESHSSETESESSEEDISLKFRDSIPIRDVFGQEYGEFYEHATKGQHVHLRYSHYISKENHYRLSDEDAVALMMNECNFYPKKLFLHEYEDMHWKWSEESLTQLLTQFFSRLESLSLRFRQKKTRDDAYSKTASSDPKKGLELVIKCCFCSPEFSSLVVTDPVMDDRTAFFPKKPCPSLNMLDIDCWSDVDKVCNFEAYANIIASHSQLTEICLRLASYLDISSSSFSCLYTSLTSFVQRPEFSKLSLHGQLPFSSHLRLVLDAFLKTPCSHPQEIHLCPSELIFGKSSPIDLPVGDNKIPSGALEHKSLFGGGDMVTVDFCEWLFSHQPLILKAFHFDSRVMRFGKYGTFIPPETSLHTQLLCNNTLFQTQDLSLTVFDDFPSDSLQNVLHRQRLTNLSLYLSERQLCGYQKICKPKSWSINFVTSILLDQAETLTEITILSSDYLHSYIAAESLGDVERFGDALFSLRNYEIFSLNIPFLWKALDAASYIVTLYNSWQKHGCRKLKAFKMGRYEYGFVLTDELYNEMGLELSHVSVRLTIPSPTISAGASISDDDHMSVSSSSIKHISSLYNLCLNQLIEEVHCYSPEMLSILPPIQRKELLLYCPIVTICHLEQTCAFNGIDSDIFWNELLNNQKERLGSYDFNEINALKVLRSTSRSHDCQTFSSSSREKYFTFLTALIFSGDRFSGHYAFFTGRDRHYFESGYAPPGKRSCPDDIINYLVAHRKPDINDDMEKEFYRDNSEKYESYYALPIRDVLGRKYGDLYKEATKGQHIHTCYSHYISKENHYRLSDEDAIALMMNECNFYPKKLVMHEYEDMHWKLSEESLTQLLTQFFSRLESLSLSLKQEKEIDDNIYYASDTSTEKKYELVLKCCFNSPALTSLIIADPVRYHCDRTALFSVFATKPCQSLGKLDVHCWNSSIESDTRSIHHLEAIANIIASHSQLTEICFRLGTDLEVAASSLSSLYSSLIGFVQRIEFSKLSLYEQPPYSSHLRRLIDTFLKTPCSQPQEVHLYLSPPDYRLSKASHTDLSISDNGNSIPSGALEYKSLFIHKFRRVSEDFCEWLCSHQPLALRTFYFDANLVNVGENGQLVPSEMAFPVQALCDNASFQTQELFLPIFQGFPFRDYQNLLRHQQLTNLSLVIKLPGGILQSVEPEPWNINDITNILRLSLRSETLTEFTITWNNDMYHTAAISVKSSDDIERFGDVLFSLQNCELFSLCIPVTWKIEDVVHIDSLYKTWQKHGCKKLKSFRMGEFEYGLVLTDELARKLDKMGLTILYTSPSMRTLPFHAESSDDESV